MHVRRVQLVSFHPREVLVERASKDSHQQQAGRVQHVRQGILLRQVDCVPSVHRDSRLQVEESVSHVL